jgi:hypothetical protein
MPKQSTDRLSTSSQLLKALTQPEIAQLIDALLGVLSAELRVCISIAIQQILIRYCNTIGKLHRD